MKKRFLLIPVFLIVLSILFLRFDLVSGLFFDSVLKLKDLNNISFVKQITEQVHTPGPLRGGGEEESENVLLTREGSIAWTNKMRTDQGLKPLSENALLNQSAQQKLEDMFANGYFEHVSPNGTRPSDVIVSVGYDYITTGENLALGNFRDDRALIQAWMDSPGHRENILNPSYQEIGIAVGQGVYEGKRVWMGVQHFGKPLSACSQPDENLKSQIDQGILDAQTLKNDIDRRKQELESTDPKSQEEAENYNRKVDEYNSIVRQYNDLLSQIEQITNTYNSQIEAFNTCAKE